MEKEIIKENNKLIGEFMGDIFKTNFTVGSDLVPEGWLRKLDNMHYGNLKYHSSWDWLMPCIGKISDLCEEPEELDGLKYALLTNNIEEAWKFVVNYLTIS